VVSSDKRIKNKVHTGTWGIFYFKKIKIYEWKLHHYTAISIWKTLNIYRKCLKYCKIIPASNVPS
jgi:hypothetical protein